MNPITQAESHETGKKPWTSLLEAAAREVFQMMLEAKLEPCAGSPPEKISDFTAMVGLAGDLCGLLSLECGTASATRIAAKMLGVAPGTVDDQMCDALGEVANMVAGDFKARLPKMGSGCLLSVPTVITGGDYKMVSLADGTLVEVALLFEGEPVWFVLKLQR